MKLKSRIQQSLPQSIYSLLRSVYFFPKDVLQKLYGGILFLYVYFFVSKPKEIYRNSGDPFFMEIVSYFQFPFSTFMAWNGICVWASSASDKLIVLRFSAQRFHVSMESEAIVLEDVTVSEKYIFVSAELHDPILEKYQFDSGLQYYILHFLKGDLIGLGGVKRGEKEFFWYGKDDFFIDMTHRKPRVLQLPIIALYAPCKYVKGLRELGYHADYLIVNDGGFRWLLDGEEPDFDLEAFGNNKLHRRIEALIYGLKYYDIFHIHSNCSFFFGPSLWEGNSDISYLRKMGKFVVSSSWGMCDSMRYGDEPRFKWFSECGICKTLRPVRCESRPYGQCVARSEKYANLRLAVARPVLAYPDQKWIDNPIDMEVYTPQLINRVPEKYILPRTEAVRIYHSFGNATGREDVKGTKYIKQAVERLIGEGYAIEFIYFHDLPHVDIKYYQIQADIVVDQLYGGWQGSTGMECMALGKPVITYVNPDVAAYVKKMGREIPVINATPDTIYEVLKSLVDSPQLREEWGWKARKFAEDYNDYRKVTKVLAGYYEEALLRDQYHG